jgi:hypothetical protein
MNWERLRPARSRADTIVLEACCRLDPPFYAPRQIHHVPIALGASRLPFELAHERAYPHLHPFISEPSCPTLLVTPRAFVCAIRWSSALILNASYPARTSPPKHWLSQYPRAAWRYSGFLTCFFYFEPTSHCWRTSESALSCSLRLGWPSQRESLTTTADSTLLQISGTRPWTTRCILV